MQHTVIVNITVFGNRFHHNHGKHRGTLTLVIGKNNERKKKPKPLRKTKNDQHKTTGNCRRYDRTLSHVTTQKEKTTRENHNATNIASTQRPRRVLRSRTHTTRPYIDALTNENGY